MINSRSSDSGNLAADIHELYIEGI